jgi:hypothetical protein
MNALTMAQTSPASNPDTNLVSIATTGNYTSGTPDPLPLTAIADSQVVVQVPLNNPGMAPPSVDPEWFGYANGYYAQVERTGAGTVASPYAWGLRWYASEGGELGSGAFPAGITGARHFLRILCPVTQQ